MLSDMIDQMSIMFDEEAGMSANYDELLQLPAAFGRFKLYTIGMRCFHSHELFTYFRSTYRTYCFKKSIKKFSEVQVSTSVIAIIA